MVKLKEIQDYAHRIVLEFQPQKIILFSSYAYGEPTQDSDVDLLVVMEVEGKPYKKAAEILTRTRPAFPTDLLVRTPQQLNERLSLGDFFLGEIIERGRTLYAS